MCASPSSRRNFGMQVVGDKAVIFGGCGVTKSNEPCVSNQTYYLHMGADPMKWELADLMGDIPSPRWRHTATLLPDQACSSSRPRMGQCRSHCSNGRCIGTPALSYPATERVARAG